MKNKNLIIKWLPVLWFILVAALYIFLYIARIDMLLDSDMSSEMLLADILTKEHGIMSKNWFYSTELRFLNNQLIFEFFLLFGHNYHVSRILSGITLMAILIISYYFLLRQMGLKNYFFATAPVLMLPFSLIYSDIVLVGLYYIPHIAISFFSLGLVFAYEKQKDPKKKRTFLIILLVLSLLAGIGGPRQIIIFYLPLLLTALIRAYVTKSFKYLSVYLAFAFSAAGYLINSKILSHFYKYNDWSGFKYTPFDSDKLDKILQGFLNVLGFADGEIFSFATVRTGGSFILIFLAIAYYIYFFNKKNELEERELITGSFFLSATVIYIIIYLFTDMFYEDRYTLPFIVFLLPLVACSLKNHKWLPIVKMIFTACFSLMIFAMSLCIYKGYWFIDKTSEHKDIVNYLNANNYTNGYATYWNANLLTELSNGSIDSFVWTSSIENIADVDDLYRWLQVKSHKDNPPKDRVFIVLSVEEYNNSVLKRYLNSTNLVYNTNSYYVFGFENYETLIAYISSYFYDLNDEGYMGTSENADGSWVINNGNATVGPFITLYKGSYTITVKGSNLSALTVNALYTTEINEDINILDPASVALSGDGNEDITSSDDEIITLVKAYDDPNELAFILSTNVNLHDFQLIVSNDSESAGIISDMSIVRN